ncbi:MAG: transketolase [Deltaproteobacteria bacterium]|nr:transketolase [Deltaproteobacteria bacterium]
MESISDVQKLIQIAKKVRIQIVKMLHQAGSGHTGGSLSAADILVALFLYKMKHKPNNPDWVQRDRFVLSKGHACPAYYAVLAECGYFVPEELYTLRQLGACLQGHPDCLLTTGVDVSTGSLGQGLSLANGMALGTRLDGRGARVYCLLGDGEVQEGQVWEAAMTAPHYRLDNLCAIIDHNHLQIDGRVEDVMNIEPLGAKWQAFGWEVQSIDGHDMKQLMEALDLAEKTKGKPTMIIAETVKGKGVSIFENQVKYHGVAPNDVELAIALRELTIA